MVVQGSTQKQRERFIDHLTHTLMNDQAMGSVYGKIDRTKLNRSLLTLLNSTKFNQLSKNLTLNQDTIKSINKNPSLETIFRSIDRRVSQTLVSTVVSDLFSINSTETSSVTHKEPLDLSFLIALLDGVSLSLNQKVSTTPWFSLLGLNAESYLTANHGAIHLLTIAPSTEVNALPDGQVLDKIRDHINKLLLDYPHVSAGITGQRAINVAELRATIRDTRIAGIIALFGIALIFILGFRNVRHALLAVTALCVGLAWSAGALTLAIGHLTVLSVAFISILLGLGIDFGIHLVARYEESLQSGLSIQDGVFSAIKKSTPGNLAGAITTSFAFFGLTFSDFLGLAELGAIAGMGVLLCLVAQLTVLPSLLILLGRRPAQSPSSVSSNSTHINFSYFPWMRPHLLVSMGTVVAVIGYLGLFQVEFDGNLLNLQADGVKAVDLEKQLIGDRSGAFAIAISSTLEETRHLSNKFKNLPEVSQVESIIRFFPEDIPARIAQAKALAPLIPKLAPKPATAIDLSAIRKSINKLRFKLRPEREHRWDTQKRPHSEQLQLARNKLQRVYDQIQATVHPDAIEALRHYQGEVINAFYSELHQLSIAAHTPKALRLSDIPSVITSRLIGKDGRYLIRIHPSENVWQDAFRTQFVHALRSIDPDVTGIPIQSFEAGKLMVNGYIQGGFYALAMVLLILMLDLRSITSMISALTPLLVGSGWLLGVMWLAGLSFNLANLIILPLMIGIGIDIGVHLQHRHMADGVTGGPLMTGSTGRAVWVSSLTTMVGFGSLAVAQHQGIHSLGVLLTIGVGANLLAATFVLAPGLKLFPHRTTHVR